MTGDFGAAVAKLRASMTGEDPWNIVTELPEHEGPSAELRARRRQGREAYERALRAHGIARQTAAIWASAHPLFADEYAPDPDGN
jgi:hypothetical protein